MAVQSGSLEIRRRKRGDRNTDYWELDQEYREIAAKYDLAYDKVRALAISKGANAPARPRMTFSVRCCRGNHKVTIVARGAAILHAHSQPGELGALRTMAAVAGPSLEGFGCLSILNELKEQWVKHNSLRWFLMMKRRVHEQRYSRNWRGRHAFAEAMSMAAIKYRQETRTQLMDDLHDWGKVHATWLPIAPIASRMAILGTARRVDSVLNTIRIPMERLLHRRRGFPAVVGGDGLFLWTTRKHDDQEIAALRAKGSEFQVWLAHRDRRKNAYVWDWPIGQFQFENKEGA